VEYRFILKYRLSDHDSDHIAIVERLGEAGCTDALVGIGLQGMVALDFSREASSAQEAMFSALADVKKAIPTATLVEASPDLVGASDVADVVGVTRQYIRKLWTDEPFSFPSPVHNGSAAIWHLAEVLLWLDGTGKKRAQPDVLDVAQTAMQVNFAKQSHLVRPRIVSDLRALVT
jgi:predicted DNA-binding transcriptional regulator AlpA